jgi:hypothetical protein
MPDDMDWLVLGDFNFIRKPSDRNKPGGRGENGTDYFRPTDRMLTELKNGFGRIVVEYDHGYG